MRITLLGASIAGVLSALAPSIAALIALRAVTGAFFGATIPALLVYVGDTVSVSTRHRVLADLMAAIAVGTALASAAGWPHTGTFGASPSPDQPWPHSL